MSSSLTFSLTVTDSFGLTSTSPSTTNVIVTYNPQYHSLSPNSPSITQNPVTGQLQQQPVLPQNAIPQLQHQQQLQPVPSNRVIPLSPSHFQNQSILKFGNQYSNNINPYSPRQYYYQNKSLAANLAPQLPHDTLPFLNLGQHPTTTSSVRQNTSLPKTQAVLNNSTHVTAGHINNTSIQPTNNSIGLARPKVLFSAR